MKRSPEVSIVVLNYNSLNDTRLCLQSVLKTEYSNFKIILIDNGSKNNESEILQKEFRGGNVIFKRIDKNAGISGGMNIGINMSKSKYIALLNNDTKVDPLWLSEMVKVLESDTKIAAVQAKIRSFYKPEYFDPSACGGFIDKLGYPYTRGRIGFYVEKDEGQYDYECDLIWGCGVGLMLKRECLKKSGLLPENFFYYHEDTDLCLRLKNSGYRIVSAPRALIYHKGSNSSKNMIPKRFFFVYRNNYLLLARNLSYQRLLWVFPLRLILDMLIGFYYLLEGKPFLFISIIKAEASFIKMFPLVLNERLKNKEFPGKAEKEMEPFSIVWEYIINKKKRYSEVSGEVSKTPVLFYNYLEGL